MKTIRTSLVHALDIKDKNKLSGLLEDTLSSEFDSENAPMYNFVTVDQLNKLFSGTQHKGITFKLNIKKFVPSLITLIATSDPMSAVVSCISNLAIMFETLKTELSEKESFLVYALHVEGETVIKMDDFGKILEKEYEDFPAYKMDHTELDHNLNKLDSKSIIKYEGEIITLIEEVQLRYK